MVSTPMNVQAASLGDLTISSGTYIIQNIEQPIDGNVTVTGTGNLTIRDATMSVISNYAPTQRRTITVSGAGATLYFDHGTITSYLDQINPWPKLNLIVQNNAHLIASGQSVLMFPGNITLSTGAHVILRDTQIVKLPDAEVSRYVVGTSGLVSFDSANDGPAISLTDSTLEMYDSSIANLPEYSTQLASNITLAGSSFMLAVNSYIGIDFGPLNVLPSDSYRHNSLVLSGSAMAELYGCTFESYIGNEADRQPAITSTGLSGAHIYRWLNVTVGDAYGVPISEAVVDAVFTGSTLYGGLDAFYFVSTGATQPLPPNSILAYMGKNATSFSATETDGIARMPFLTDMISGSLGSGAIFLGSYAMSGSTVINSILYSSTESFSFPAYPAMGPGDRSFDVTVEIRNVSAPSPDQSRWLVVPVSSTQPSLTIEEMTYYHAGDVIVAAGGTLTFDNAVFELVQAYSNQRTVYVDGTIAQPGKLVFEKSRMNSDMGINIIVKGYAVLEVLNSTFTGVNIIALDHSTVLLNNASIDQQISTAWDSHAVIDVKDSTLIQPIVLSGYSTGGFTNTSVPSIKVMDSAEAWVYRWIQVTVFDGAGKPLPNATVSAYYLVSGVFAKSATTSSDPLSRGVAQIKANGTKITAFGSTFVGNYKVSAVYVWGSPAQYYWSDQNISVGVMPYSEPLGKNATYATMRISSALPHLFINQAMGPVVASPANPLKNQLVSVNATVNNSGPVGAYNVKVDFFDNGVLFDTVIIPEIKPGDHAVANGHWLATSPLSPTPHNISISADPRVANMTPVVGWVQVIVQALPDLVVLPGITVASSYPEINTQTTVSATIANNGDITATPVTIDFRDDGVLFYHSTGNSIGPYGQMLRESDWTPTTDGIHIISVLVSTPQAELSTSNNISSISIVVFPHPDLVLSNMVFVPTGPVSGGTVVVVRADLVNTGAVPIYSPDLRLDVTGTGVSMLPQTSTLSYITNLRDSDVVTVEASFTAPTLNQQTDVTVSATINPDGTIIESDYTNNNVVGHITVLDVRPDLSILPGEISITRGTTNVTALSEQFGRTITITADVQNLGGQPITDPGFRADIGIRSPDEAVNYTKLFNATGVEIGGNSTNHSTKIVWHWTISLTTPGQYQIWVFLDPSGTIDEPDKTNNFAFKNFTLNALSMNVEVISSSGNEFKAGDFVSLAATFTYADSSGDPVKLLPGVQFWLVDSNDNTTLIVGSNSTVRSTNPDDGMIVTSLRVPVGLPSGNYKIRAVVPDSTGIYLSTAIHVSAIKAPSLLPTWAWLAIIIGAVAVVLGFLGYTYKYGLGKLVECGECGAFIPAASKRCPKCGVEFEVGTMKCSECGAWIPAESTECSNCGVKFVGETEGETDYLERMKKDYDEMTSKYRELAKGELGKKFSERDFDDWFKRQPGYISFDDWLAKEEEKKLEGPIPCKVCGTLNPKEATVCHKCGTVFSKEEPPRKGQPPQGAEPSNVEATAEPTAQAQPQPVAPRMVIRRPIDRKVVPKKIIKSPMGGGESGENEQQ
jgi:subtilase family serine protease/ribosomal protein L40E